MDLTKRIFKFQSYDMKKSIFGFWGVMLLVNIFAYISVKYFNSQVRVGINSNGLYSIIGSNMMAICIYFIIYGILMYHECFSLALSFGITRRDFYKSALVNNILVVLIFSVIQSVLQILDKYIMESLGYKPMLDFGLFNTGTDSILYIIFTLSLLFLTFIAVTNLVGILQYKYGYKFWIGLGIIFFILINLFSNISITEQHPREIRSNIKLLISEMIKKVYLWLNLNFSNSIILIIIEVFIIIVCYTVGYLLIKRLNIKNK